jgi:hypothetical protein
MRRAARPVMYLGVVGVVLGLGAAHASFIGHYSFTSSSRFAWSIAYAGILCVVAYGFGLPDVPRSRQAALGPAVGAAFLGALGMSLVQLFVGDALLPRFVVFGASLLLPDWYRLCVGMALGGRSRAEARDRIAVVASFDEVSALEDELRGSPERPASITASFSVDDAMTGGDGARPLDRLAASTLPTVLVLGRDAQDVPEIVVQAARLHASGVKVRSLTLFYEEWLGKLPLAELERASFLFDIGEVHRAGYGRAKRLLDIPLAAVGVVALVVLSPIVWVANLLGNRGPLLYRQPRIGKGGEPFTIVKFRTMAPREGGDLADEWTTEDDPADHRVRARAAQDAPRRAAPGRQHPAR